MQLLLKREKLYYSTDVIKTSLIIKLKCQEQTVKFYVLVRAGKEKTIISTSLWSNTGWTHMFDLVDKDINMDLSAENYSIQKMEEFFLHALHITEEMLDTNSSILDKKLLFNKIFKGKA